MSCQKHFDVDNLELEQIWDNVENANKTLKKLEEMMEPSFFKGSEGRTMDFLLDQGSGPASS